jgi:iron(III) transport system ATP-binding protein
MITIAKLCKDFHLGDRTVNALRDVTLEIAAGEFFVLLGSSGSGKTTLVRCVAGLEHATSGEIALGANLVYSGARKILVRPEDRNIGMVFQSYAVWPHLTVFENIALPLSRGRKRLPAAEVKERVARVLESVDLQGLESRPIPMLSGGQQQRVSLARALAVEPDALLMDEPLSNLDARLREKVRDQIRLLAKKFGITVLYVTHDQTEAMALADRIAVMEHGEVRQVGVPRELYSRPRTPEIAEFFGDMNWLAGRRNGAGTIETAIGPIHADGAASDGEAVRLGIRPENVALSLSNPGSRNAFPGRIETVTFLGERQSIIVDVKGAKMMLHANGALELGASDVWIDLPVAAILMFPA